jgi:hypothetical protein
VRALPALAAGLCILTATQAHAARRLLAWTFDTETLPERGVELEQWLSEDAGENGANSWDLFWSVEIGITDQISLSLPITWRWADGQGTNIYEYGADLRWRMVTSDPVMAPKIVPLLRLAVLRPLVKGERNAIALEGNLVLSTDVIPHVHVILDSGVRYEDGDTEGASVEGNFKLGASVGVGPELRVGATVWANAVFKGAPGDNGWLSAGPDVSWTHGRFWLTAGIQFGITSGDMTSPVYQPRVAWGVLF